MSNPFTKSPVLNYQNGHPFPITNIMVVDDDNDDAVLVRDTIKEISPKYGVICVHQSKQVLETLDACTDTELPSLLILDYNMPIVSGLDLLKLLKANPRYARIPVGVYSNSVFPKHKGECMEAGACIYLSKSASVNGLREDVKQLLSHCL